MDSLRTLCGDSVIAAARATKKEYAVVFPDYFYGQIYEARHQPGTFALPPRLVLEMLESTCAEIGRASCRERVFGYV